MTAVSYNFIFLTRQSLNSTLSRCQDLMSSIRCYGEDSRGGHGRDLGRGLSMRLGEALVTINLYRLIYHHMK